jgi:hypothetical protein
MNYLVARGLSQVLQRLRKRSAKPLQVLEKLPELAGNTNVMKVTGKLDPETA